MSFQKQKNKKKREFSFHYIYIYKYRWRAGDGIQGTFTKLLRDRGGGWHMHVPPKKMILFSITLKI